MRPGRTARLLRQQRANERISAQHESHASTHLPSSSKHVGSCLVCQHEVQ